MTSFSVVASAVNGDSFLLRPTRNGAEGFRVLVDAERDIAAERRGKRTRNAPTVVRRRRKILAHLPRTAA